MRHLRLVLVLVCLSLTVGCFSSPSVPPQATPIRPAATPTVAPPSPTSPPATTVAPPTAAPSATPTFPTVAQATGVRPAATTTATRPAATATRAAATTTPSSVQVPATPPVAGATGWLRTVDWNTFLTTDPNLEHVTNAPPIPGTDYGPFVRVKGTKPEDGQGGYAVTRGILYADISGDGREEAIISLASGGTAGNAVILVYREGANGPALVKALPGYKIGAVAEGGRLVIREPLYAGWEPNCCASGLRTTRYQLRGADLAQVDRTTSGIPEMRVATVEKFYELINAKQLREAYAFLSPAYQQANSYDRWAAGYQNTVSASVKTTDLPAESAVGVTLTATDRTPSGNVTRTFTGKWTLAWNAERRQWVLERGVLQPQ